MAPVATRWKRVANTAFLAFSALAGPYSFICLPLLDAYMLWLRREPWILLGVLTAVTLIHLLLLQMGVREDLPLAFA